MSELVALGEHDAAAASALLAPSLGPSWSERATHEELTRRGALALAIRIDGRLDAALLGWVIAGELEINAVVVRPEARRRGLGLRLVRAALDRAIAVGASSAFLELRADNEAAMQLYRRAGFAPFDRRARYYDDGADAVVMRAELA